MTSEYIGIEIGRQKIGLAVVEADRNHVEIIEKRFLDLGHSFSVELLEKSLSDLMAESGQTPKPVILSITPLIASFRLIDLPFSSENKIRQIIGPEMETLIPFQSENMQTSFVRLSSRSGKGASSVLACCIDGDMLDGITEVFKKSGMEIVASSVSGYVTASAFASGISGGYSGNALVYVDISPDSLTISIIKSGEVVFVRSVAMKNGIVPDPVVVADESARTLTYYCDFHDPEFVISDCMLSLSGMSDVEWFDDSWNKKIKEAFSARGISCCKIDSESPDTISILSAAMLYTSGKCRLNFARSGFFKAGVLKSLRKNWTDTFAVVCITLLTAFFYLGVSEYTAFRSDKKLDGEIKSIFMETFPDTKKLVDPYQQMSVKVKSLMQNQGTDSEKGKVIDILKEISGKIKPEMDITVTSFTMLPDEIQIHGESSSFDLAETARKSLAESKLFSEVKVDSVTSDSKTGKVVFKLNLKRGVHG